MKEKFHFDKLSIGKWLLIAIGGLCGLCATFFDTKIKDRLYEKKLDKEIERQTKRLLGEDEAA